MAVCDSTQSQDSEFKSAVIQDVDAIEDRLRGAAAIMAVCRVAASAAGAEAENQELGEGAIGEALIVAQRTITDAANELQMLQLFGPLSLREEK